MMSSLMSVFTPDAFFGHDTHRPGPISAATAPMRPSNSRRDDTNQITSAGAPASRVDSRTEAGRSTSSSRNPRGAPRSATVVSGAIPSFLTNGVPE